MYSNNKKIIVVVFFLQQATMIDIKPIIDNYLNIKCINRQPHVHINFEE